MKYAPRILNKCSLCLHTLRPSSLWSYDLLKTCQKCLMCNGNSLVHIRFRISIFCWRRERGGPNSLNPTHPRQWGEYERKRKRRSPRLMKWMSPYSRCAELSGEPFGSSRRITYSNPQPIMLSNYSASCRPNKWLWQNTERSHSEIPENALSAFSLSAPCVWCGRSDESEQNLLLWHIGRVNDIYICTADRKKTPTVQDGRSNLNFATAAWI